MGDLKSARTPFAYAVAVATKATEYSKELPSSTRELTLSFSVASKTTVYWSSAATAASRYTVAAGAVYNVFNLDLPASTYVYFQCASTTGTMSILGWRG